MSTRPNYDGLDFEVAAALRQHYQQWVLEHQHDEVYAYVIYPTPLCTSISVSVLSEQGLSQVAHEYKTKHGYEETLEQLTRELRWSVADTPYCGDHQELFDPVNDRLRPMLQYVDSLEVSDPAFGEHMETLHKVLVDALKQFRRKALTGASRPMLYIDFGDMSDEKRLWFIKQCNDEEEVVDWYLATLNS